MAAPNTFSRKNKFKNVTYLDIQFHCIFLHWIQDHIYKFQVLNRFHVVHKILYTLLCKSLYHQVHNLDSRILHWQLLSHFPVYIEWLVLSDMWHIWEEFWHTMCNLWHPEIKRINFKSCQLLNYNYIILVSTDSIHKRSLMFYLLDKLKRKTKNQIFLFKTFWLCYTLKSSNFHLHQQKIFWFLVFSFSLSNE